MYHQLLVRIRYFTCLLGPGTGVELYYFEYPRAQLNAQPSFEKKQCVWKIFYLTYFVLTS